MKRATRRPEPHPLDIPDILKMTPEQRAECWRRNPPRPMINMDEIKTTRNEDETTAQFRAEVEEQRRLKSLAQIAKMKMRFETKKVDRSNQRWDATRNRWVEDKHATQPARQDKVATPEPRVQRIAVRKGPVVDAGGIDWSRITKDNAEAIAKLNGVWKDSYEKLRGTGRIVMTVSNVLKGVVKKGGEVKWS